MVRLASDAWSRRLVASGGIMRGTHPDPEEDPMPHTAIAEVGAAVEIQEGAVVSKVIHRDQDLDVTVFGFDAGEGLTEHTASRPAIVQVLSGRMRLTADGEELDAGPGFWLHMTAGTPHALVAVEPCLMLLTLLRPAG
jgi:quercetin dioxygenase-like cupin family protein